MSTIQNLILRESDRIRDFLEAMMSQNRMSKFEEQLVLQEGIELLLQAGHLDSNENHHPSGDESSAITKHSNHLKRRKILELHPEMREELSQFIEHRPHHPLRPVPSHLERPGMALEQYVALNRFIELKRREGLITHNEAHAIYEPAIRVIEDSGYAVGEVDKNTDKAVLVQAHALMKQSLVSMHPEFKSDLNRLGGDNRSR